MLRVPCGNHNDGGEGERGAREVQHCNSGRTQCAECMERRRYLHVLLISGVRPQTPVRAFRLTRVSALRVRSPETV